MLSVTPRPLVDSNVNVLEVVVPPIISGVVTLVPATILAVVVRLFDIISPVLVHLNKAPVVSWMADSVGLVDAPVLVLVILI